MFHRIRHFTDVLLSFLYGYGNHLLKSAFWGPKLFFLHFTVRNLGGSVEFLWVNSLPGDRHEWNSEALNPLPVAYCHLNGKYAKTIHRICGLSGRSPATVNITRMVYKTLMQPGSQEEWTGTHMREQWWPHCNSQWGSRFCWVSMCTVWLSYSNDWVNRTTNLHQILH